jgi:hypothetical protein
MNTISKVEILRETRSDVVSIPSEDLCYLCKSQDNLIKISDNFVPRGIPSDDLNDNIDDLETAVVVRYDGNFYGRALLLSKNYNWQLGIDTFGATILIPTKKKKRK